MDLELPVYSLDHTRPIVGYGQFSQTSPELSQGKMVNDTIRDEKLSMFRYILDNNLLETPDPDLKNKVIKVLRDKTLLAYSYLRYDETPVKMYGLQDAILSDTHDRILFCGCNQKIGKSFTLNVDAATEFIIDHGKNWIGILVSGSLPQSQFQMDRIKQLLKSSNITYREEETIDTKTGKKDNTTQLSYTFFAEDGQTPLYRNLLICCPHTSSALGYPADNLWLDEFDFWENCDQERFLYQVAIPRTFKTKGKIKIYTNPDGKEKMMYKLWNAKDKDGNPAWHRYHFNYWDAPDASQSEFDKLIVGMTRGRIESTLLAVFTRTEGSFFSSEEIRDMFDTELAQKGDSAGYGKETAWFLDVGSVHDQSVLIGAYLEENKDEPDNPVINAFYIHKYPVGFPLARVVGVDNAIDTEDGWEDDIEDNPSVKQVLGDYSLEFNGKNEQPLFAFDATGNAGMLPLFTAADIDAIDVTFTGKHKWEMYQRYQYYVQRRFLKRGKERDFNTVRGCTFDYQASKLVIRKGSKTVYKQVHHENEDDLDDTQDSMAGLIYLISPPNGASLSFDIINHEGKSMVDELRGMGQDADRFKDEYIPGWMNKGELSSWQDSRELT